MPELPVASLGYQSPINVGSYIPAPAYRPSLHRQMLEAFLTGAGGAAGSHLTEAAFTPDVSREANADPTLIAQHATPGPRNAFQRFFTPMTQEQLNRAKEIAQTGQYQQQMEGLEKQRVGLEGQNVDIARGRAASEAGYQTAEEKHAADELVRENAEFGARLPIEQAQSTAAIGASTAQAREANAQAAQSELLNRRLSGQDDQSILSGLQNSHPEVDHVAASAQLQKIGPPSRFFREHPGAVQSDYENAFITGAQDFAKANSGNPAPPVKPTGLGSLFSGLFSGPNGNGGSYPGEEPWRGNTPASVGIGGPSSGVTQGNGQGVIPPEVMQMLHKFMTPGQEQPQYTPMGQGGPR